MARINNKGYVERKTAKRVYRDWWLVKEGSNVLLPLPKDLIGCKIKFKVEVIK